MLFRSESVAAAGLRGVAAGHVLVIPGIGYRALSSVSSVMPRSAIRRIVGLLQI